MSGILVLSLSDLPRGRQSPDGTTTILIDPPYLFSLVPLLLCTALALLSLVDLDVYFRSACLDPLLKRITPLGLGLML